MALFASFTKKSKLDAAVKKTAQARDSESSTADQLFKEVYQDYADIMAGDSLRAATLYHWGVALLHQAKMKSPAEAINIYRNAIAKFSFCMTIEPSYLAAAIDAGVACMDLARARGVATSDELYEMAKRQFEKANSIQAGSAAYNLACIYGLRGDNDSCLAELKIAKEKGSLPDKADIFADPDMASVVKEKWFTGFFDSIEKEKRAEEERKQAEKTAAEAAIKAEKEKKDNAYDPYRSKSIKADETDKPKETSKQTTAKSEKTGEDISTEEAAESITDNTE